MPAPNYTYAMYFAQTWNGEELISEVDGLSLPAAREVARAAVLTGHTGRVMSREVDYTEVYAADGLRTGPWAATTRVRVPREG